MGGYGNAQRNPPSAAPVIDDAVTIQHLANQPVNL